MENDDDDLDLDAWQPPAPPPGIADAVFARMHGAPISTPVEITRRPRKWWVVGGLAVGLAMTTITGAIVSDMFDHMTLSRELNHMHEEVAHLHDDLAAAKQEAATAKQEVATAKKDAADYLQLVQWKHDSDLDVLKAQLSRQQPGGAPKAADPPKPKPADPPKPAKAADPPKPCDAASLKATGEHAFTAGDYAAALTSFEQALACKPDDQLEKLAYLAACDAKNAVKAKLHFGHLAPASWNTVRVVCVRNGIMLDDPPLPCDPDALKQSGDDNAGAGLYAQALSAYERAVACRPSLQAALSRLEYMESCNLKNRDKVHKYWKVIPAAQRDNNLRSICVRNGMGDPDQ